MIVGNCIAYLLELDCFLYFNRSLRDIN